MQILNSTVSDIDEIFKLYNMATALQKTIPSATVWPEFDRGLIETEISENRQWKIVIEQQIVCVFATTFSDPQIWEERNIDPSVYIHRIATHSDFRGKNFVKTIVQWAKAYGKQHDKKFVRLDTIGGNDSLINYYQKSGFTYLGLSLLKNTDQLPSHYHNVLISLFEITI